MQRSILIHACSKICRANLSAINRRQRSTALDTEQGQQRDRCLPISPVLLVFRPLLTVKAATSCLRPREHPFYDLIPLQTHVGTPRVCFETEILCPEERAGR